MYIFIIFLNADVFNLKKPQQLFQKEIKKIKKIKIKKMKINKIKKKANLINLSKFKLRFNFIQHSKLILGKSLKFIVTVYM